MGDDLNIPQSVDPQLLQQVSQAAQSTPLPTTQGSGMGAQPQGPPKPRPILMDLFQGLFGSQDSRGYGAAQNGQQARPVSRLDVFENFLGNFVQAMGAGLSEAHGRGAAAKGFGAAVQAPYQQAVGQYQLGQQAQAQQAETQLKQAQASQLQNVVQTPYGPMSAALAAKIWPAEIAAQGKQGVADTAAGSREKVAGINADSRETVAGENNATRKDIAAQTSAQRYEMFKQTQQYRVWKANLDNSTKLRVASMTQGKAPAAMMQTATFAQSGLNRLDDAQTAFSDLEKRGVLGSVSSDKMEDWIFGKGLIDPSLPAKDRQEIGQLRAALSYTSSAAMRAHTGRTSKEIYQDFKTTLGLGQGADALRGAFTETRSMLGDYASSASDESIQRLRGGNVPPSKASVEDLVKKYQH